jgi:TrmH family RNA methyltransferase
VSLPEVRRIESTSNPAIRRWRELHKRRERDRRALCIIEGTRELSRAADAEVRFAAVLVKDGAAPSDLELARSLVPTGAEHYELGEAAMGRVSVRRHPGSIIGIAHSPAFSLPAVALSANPLVLIADSIEKPGNIGAMIRSADGAGADAVIVSDPATDLVNPNVIRASQGAVFSGAVASAIGEQAQRWLRTQEIPVVAATVEARTPLWDCDFTGPLAIVIGSEHAGLSPAWQSAAQVAIPMRGHGDSLNASIAAAVLLYEAQRQRRE